jgi:hypothetical protein
MPRRQKHQRSRPPSDRTGKSSAGLAHSDQAPRRTPHRCRANTRQQRPALAPVILPGLAEPHDAVAEVAIDHHSFANEMRGDPGPIADDARTVGTGNVRILQADAGQPMRTQYPTGSWRRLQKRTCTCPGRIRRGQIGVLQRFRTAMLLEDRLSSQAPHAWGVLHYSPSALSF